MISESCRVARAALLNEYEGIYLNTSAEGLPLSVARNGHERYLSAKSRGSAGRSILDEIEFDARVEFAQLLRVPSENVGFVGSTSRALDAAIKSIRWEAGDNIVLPAIEFPTALYAAELLKSHGVVVRTVPPQRDGGMTEADLIEALDTKTRLVVISYVSFYSGQILAVEHIVERAHAVGALVFLDCVQAVGNVEVDVGDADFAAAASFKWLQGVHGAAGLYVSPQALEKIHSPYIAYRSVSNLFEGEVKDHRLHEGARRFEEGLPDYGALAVLVETLRASSGWRNDIAGHNEQIGERLSEGFQQIGLDVIAPGAARSSIVSFRHSEFESLRTALLDDGIHVWARDGRVRFSGHIYTTLDDVDSALHSLRRAVARWG